jgi:hypothetical protein
MPQQIEVPGVGVVEFPDGMSDEQIGAAIKQSLAKSPAIDTEAAGNFMHGAATYGAGRELAHNFTMGLARPVYAAGGAVENLLERAIGKGNGQGIADAYLRGEKEYDAAREQYRSQNPIMSTIAGLGGGAASLAGAGAVGLPGAIGRIWQGAKAGGTYGGVSGLAEANGSAGERLAEGAKGLGIGAAIGAAVPAAIDVARTATAPIRSMFSAATKPEQTAVRQIAQAMEDGSISPTQAQQALQEARAAGVRDMTLADVGGKNAQQLAATYAKSPGPGKQAAADFLEQRMAGRGENLVDVARPALGHPEQTYGAIDQLIEQRAKAATPLYERARNTPLDTTRPEYDAIMRELETPSGQQALAAAARKMADEKVPSKMIPINAGQDGSVTLSRLPDTRTLDYVKRAIDDKIQAARRVGNMDDARIFQSVKNGVVNNLDQLNPAYKSARAAFAGPSESKDAIEAGMQFLTMPSEDIRKVMQGLSQADREFARLGAARALKDIAGASSDRTRELLSGNMRERMQEIFPDKGSYDRAYQGWQAIKGQSDLARRVLGGSQTYENFAQAGDAALDPSILLHAAHGNFLGATKDALRGLANRFGGITPKVGANGIEMLLSPDQAKQQAALDAIFLATMRSRVAPANIALGGRPVTGGLLGALDPQQLQ